MEGPLLPETRKQGPATILKASVCFKQTMKTSILMTNPQQPRCVNRWCSAVHESKPCSLRNQQLLHWNNTADVSAWDSECSHLFQDVSG